jgi:uncharacterized protein (TIGR03000 family)
MPNPTASVRVVVTANAEVWFDGKLTSQTGPVRLFQLPAATENASHTIKARWVRDGRKVTGASNVQVHSGQRVTVDFVTPELEETR